MQLLPGGAESESNLHLLRLILVAMSQTFHESERISSSNDNSDDEDEESANGYGKEITGTPSSSISSGSFRAPIRGMYLYNYSIVISYISSDCSI